MRPRGQLVRALLTDHAVGPDGHERATFVDQGGAFLVIEGPLAQRMATVLQEDARFWGGPEDLAALVCDLSKETEVQAAIALVRGES